MGDYSHLLPNTDATDIPQKSNPVLKVEKIFQREEYRQFLQKQWYDKAFKEAQQKFPDWSEIAHHFYTSGLLQQKIIQDQQKYRDQQLQKRRY